MNGALLDFLNVIRSNGSDSDSEKSLFSQIAAEAREPVMWTLSCLTSMHAAVIIVISHTSMIMIIAVVSVPLWQMAAHLELLLPIST